MLIRWAEMAAEDGVPFHSEQELKLFRDMGRALPDTTNALFIGSGACVDCHGSDPEGLASVIGEGVDINVVDDWRATMMANSAKDPFWRAKVSHEVIVNPQFQEEIETTCTSCHAPMGHFEAMYLGEDHYSISQLENDTVALDGVSCVACHQMSEGGLGDFFSGQLFYDTSRVAYGPFLSPLASPMIENSGYTPVYSDHINDAGLCAGCHTLITETIDLEGNLTGNHFVEQATYHEWLNSVYNDETSCQSCHVPRVDGPVKLAAGYDTEPRSPFGLHYFVGGNTYMVELMGENREDLGIDATLAQFDSVLARTTRLLQQQTLELDLALLSRDADTAFFQLDLQNLAGHKFPSGYPSRLALIEFVVEDDNGDTLFFSGELDSEFRIVGRDPDFEPHHRVIRQEDQVQIYELVMQDVAGNVTTVLELAESPAKDNRIPPIGFTDFHPVYDTTEIIGTASTDLDFNRNGKAQGTGKDVVYYNVPMFGYTESISAKARVLYQSLPPRWMDEMFAESSAEIDYFKQLYNNQDPEAVVIAVDSALGGTITSLDAVLESDVSVTAGRGQIEVNSAMHTIESLQLYNLQGKLLYQSAPNNVRALLSASFNPGIYVLYIKTGGQRVIRKIWVP